MIIGSRLANTTFLRYLVPQLSQYRLNINILWLNKIGLYGPSVTPCGISDDFINANEHSSVVIHEEINWIFYVVFQCDWSEMVTKCLSRDINKI